MKRKPRKPRRPRGSRQPGVSPQIFVKIRSEGAYAGYDYVKARIQVRRAKYRYLVWWEHCQKREFYLGAVKILPLSSRPDRAAGLTSAAGAGDHGTGVRKA